MVSTADGFNSGWFQQRIAFNSGWFQQRIGENDGLVLMTDGGWRIVSSGLEKMASRALPCLQGENRLTEDLGHFGGGIT